MKSALRELSKDKAAPAHVALAYCDAAKRLCKGELKPEDATAFAQGRVQLFTHEKEGHQEKRASRQINRYYRFFGGR